MNEMENKIKEALSSLKIKASIEGSFENQSVLTIVLKPGEGSKLSDFTKNESEIAFKLGLESLRITPIKGEPLVAFEITKAMEVKEEDMALPIDLAIDTFGKAVRFDLADTPHLIIAGTTGSGKSVAISTILASLLKQNPDAVKLALIDPKEVEFNVFANAPHLVGDIITDTDEACDFIGYLKVKMAERFKALREVGYRNIRDARVNGLPMPYIVLVIDEFASFSSIPSFGKDVAVLAAKGRACGIHLVLATQRPSASVISNVIKANIPSRIALKVATAENSDIILDQPGAEKLAGSGDMLFLMNGQNAVRCQSNYVKDDEIRNIIKGV